MMGNNYHQQGALPDVVTSFSTTKAGIVSRWRSNRFLGVTRRVQHISLTYIQLEKGFPNTLLRESKQSLTLIKYKDTKCVCVLTALGHIHDWTEISWL